jgi:hypothetical protein
MTPGVRGRLGGLRGGDPVPDDGRGLQSAQGLPAPPRNTPPSPSPSRVCTPSRPATARWWAATRARARSAVPPAQIATPPRRPPRPRPQELSLGFAINGVVDPALVLAKAGLVEGHALVLTKPLGTGIVFAADMRALAPSEAVDAALASMQLSNGPAAAIFRAHGAVACTDVTGFGLAGHLSEMLKASGPAPASEARAGDPLQPSAAARGPGDAHAQAEPSARQRGEYLRPLQASGARQPARQMAACVFLDRLPLVSVGCRVQRVQARAIQVRSSPPAPPSAARSGQPCGEAGRGRPADL